MYSGTSKVGCKGLFQTLIPELHSLAPTQPDDLRTSACWPCRGINSGLVA